MARCRSCNRKGLFFRVNTEGLCNDCAVLARLKIEQEKLIADFEANKGNAEQSLNEITAKLDNKNATYVELCNEAKRCAMEEIEQQLQEVKDAVEVNINLNNDLMMQNHKTSMLLAANEKKIQKQNEVLKSLLYSKRKLKEGDSVTPSMQQLTKDTDDLLAPTVQLKLQCMNIRDLRKEFTKNQKHINNTFDEYKGRYTTKTNQTIYKLMVIALRSELQNVLYNIGFGKLDISMNYVKEITAKYQSIALAGNQTIAPTLKAFIGEMEYYFIRAVEIEYEYYVQKERIKEEQRALREKMRQEAADRKELERQQKQIEKEEQKYTVEINTVNELLTNEKDLERIKQLEERLAKLQAELSTIHQTKEEIINLRTGKAGNIYIISNLGAFGDSIFKIGMTRRLDPMERVKELGDASVPFPFDVHSFIFSSDAVALEASLHHRLNGKRVNKVNRRKEFFSTTINELESLVYELEPTAEFNKSMLAEQYNQSLSIDEVPEEFDVFNQDEDDENKGVA